MSDRRSLLQNLPAIDKLLHTPPLRELAGDCPHVLLVEAAQRTVAELRQQILDDSAPEPACDIEAVAARAAVHARKLNSPSLKKVLNVTGTLLHTNLGRAPLCKPALEAMTNVSAGYSNLEYDLDKGQRGKRFRHVEELICQLTGAEAATVVNNNAGAVLLALSALASGKEALVSRGELIEIGGSFRIPDIMAAGNVKLVEIGTTNKTHLDDYRKAITADTALILKVHTSNYRIVGFTEAVPGSELADLGKERGVIVLEDLGSGLLIDLSQYGLPPEPTVSEALKTGIDILTFSGDKLLGGPQAGIIVGRKEIVERLRQHPMARALRIDKMTLAAIEATLRLYLDPDKALQEIPTLQMLSKNADTLRSQCEGLIAKLESDLAADAEFEIIPTHTTVGGGALPLAELPGFGIALKPKSISPNRLSDNLRKTDPPVIGRIQDDLFIIDPRTLAIDEEPFLCQALAAALSKVS